MKKFNILFFTLIIICSYSILCTKLENKIKEKSKSFYLGNDEYCDDDDDVSFFIDQPDDSECYANGFIKVVKQKKKKHHKNKPVFIPFPVPQYIPYPQQQIQYVPQPIYIPYNKVCKKKKQNVIVVNNDENGCNTSVSINGRIINTENSSSDNNYNSDIIIPKGPIIEPDEEKIPDNFIYEKKSDIDNKTITNKKETLDNEEDSDSKNDSIKNKKGKLILY
jgi:hypothetical protein